ncbi:MULTISPECIES: energy-dependent translational throttle protein EttA [spotted fever group]|uniref:Energy-dependent translational throttle protein EttA n=3 Tax=spotted fever group TaxID=114277 RepID=B0BW07_RICRO|nr:MULTISPECIES: energy-dependent translational throttle protein EttA [spotted fever group]ABV75696.1 putative ABC transporter ATP-binding component [Rickettsia rickettsii str. 'Sheila Smith']ABY72033.1 ABC transporter ATP-binding protein [Rickettsia rickettsii str. Iowa]AFB22741.1 putative ABC transporter ATP-binding protein [Rickettsia rickettsii str. Brazil]AFB23024.1 putative ABC transporter ATP-binding protein [Rickettsia rickettsii str. Colombia]AFB24374.1 putative ABC transporter ATP-bi
MSYQYVYEMVGLSKIINGKRILKETNLSFLPKAKIGIIGPNGAGKSTLLKIMAGIDKEFEGKATAKIGIKVGYLPQEPYLDASKNVFDNIIEGLHEKKKLIDEFNYISNKFAAEIADEEMQKLFDKQAELQEKIDNCDGWNLEREIEIAMLALRCPPKEADITKISGGEKRRVALCKLLLEKPDMLLLDEPTNHLDAESVSWLEDYLKHYEGTVIVITHDRYFLDNVTEWILEIDRGNCIPWELNYSSWLEQKQKKLALESKEDDDRKKQLNRELEWIRQTPKARQSKNKARITAYQELLNKQQEQKTDPTQIIIPNGPRLGDLVIEAEHIAKKFNNKILLSDFSFKVPRGAIVGIIGPNGAGKSTLFNIITGKIMPDSGSIKIGQTVKLGYVDQSRDHLDDNKTIWEEISEGLDELQLGNRIIKSRAYCAAFNFRGGDQQKKVGQLSGGERNRVHLAKLLKEGANVILLDEPSNDLDIDTLRALEDAILDFAGCVLVISHDRWFLDRITTHIISYDKENNATWFEGNYQDYHEYMLSTNGESILNPKYKHKKLI